MSVGNLKLPGAVLLISCYELGHQPIGIASPLAFLERAGFHPTCLDTSTQPFDETLIMNARFAGISVPMHTALRLGWHTARQIRELNPDCHICFFGLYASLNSAFLLNGTGDSVIGGEYEEALVRLVEALDSGGGKAVDGVGRAANGTPPYLGRLLFAVPQREPLPRLEKYARIERGGHRHLVGYVEASRGCKHHCLHCPIPPVYGGRFFVVPGDVVLEDIARLVRMGARHITFGDPDFLNGPRHSLKIVRRMRELFSFLTFDFTAKVEHLLRNKDLLPEFRDCGCVFITTAAESLSDTVLANLEKGHTRADFFEVMRIVRNSGIVLRPSWVSFTPWTTLDDYQEVLDVAEAENLLDCIDPIQYAVRLLVPPGSHLLSRPAIQPYLGSLEPERFTYEWTHPDQRMDELHASVSELVESAVAEGADPLQTFARVRELALAVRDGRDPDWSLAVPPAILAAPTRLTEPWFC